jgi:hypothetical protein
MHYKFGYNEKELVLNNLCLIPQELIRFRYDRHCPVGTLRMSQIPYVVALPDLYPL